MVLLTAAENGHQQRSRLPKLLNVLPEGTLPVFSSPAALLEDRFERSIVKPYEDQNQNSSAHIFQSLDAAGRAVTDWQISRTFDQWAHAGG